MKAFTVFLPAVWRRQDTWYNLQLCMNGKVFR